MSGEFIDVISQSALADLEKLNAELVKTVANVKNVNQNMIGVKTPSGSDSAIKSLNEQLTQQDATIKRLQSSLQQLANTQRSVSTSSANLSNSVGKATKGTREQSVQSQILRAETDRQIRANTLLGGAYAKSSAQLLILKKQAKDYAIALGETHPKTLQAIQDANDLSGRIKSADNAVGDFQRNVGNYSGAVTKGLSSVWGALRKIAYIVPGLGIAGLLGLIIDPLVEVVKGMDLFKTKIDSVIESKKQLSEISNKGNKDAVQEQLNVKSLIAISKDANLSYQQRKIAVDELQKTYPAYFGNLTKEQILAGDTAKAEKELTDAILSRAKANAAVSKITENQSKIIDVEVKRLELRKELKATDDNLLITQKALQKSDNVSNSQGIALSQQYERKKRLIKEINVLSGDKATLDKINNVLTSFAVQNQKDAILLDYEEDKTKDKQLKQKREKIHLDFAEVESQYALKLAILERQKAEINDRVTNEKAQLDDRLKAREEFSAKSIEILKLETDKEKALLLEKYNDDLTKNNLAYKNKDITAKEWATNIGDIQNRFNNEKSKSDVVYSTKWEALMREDLDFFKKIQKQKKGFSDAYLDDIYKKELELSKKSADNQDLTMRKRQEAYEKNTRLQEDYNEELRRRELLNQVDLLQIQEINKRYDDLNATLIASSKIDSPLAKAQKDTDKFIDTLTSGQLESGLSSIGLASAKMFLDFDRNGETTFDKLFAGAENLQEKFAVTFSAIADIAKDVFNYISEQSNKNFENELNNLSKQKEVAILFAGDSASARDEIERQYDVKQREIRRRQAKAEKEQAKFSIIINTAQAIVGYLAKQQYGFALVAAAIGAVQLGVVSAQKLPEFYKGTDNAPEGWALTQEKGREIITDSKGRIKSKGSDKGAQLTYLNKGDKVFTNSETLMFDNNLNNILSSNGISSSQNVVVNNANLERKLDELINVTFNKPVPNLGFVNGDFKRTVQSGHTTQIIENKRINFQGQKV